MDLYREIENLRSGWNDRSAVGKVQLVFAFIMAVLAIGSLADAVYSFKGFLAEGLALYRNSTQYVATFFERLLPVKFERYYIDLATFLIFSNNLLDRHNLSESEIFGWKQLIYACVLGISGFWLGAVITTNLGPELAIIICLPLLILGTSIAFPKQGFPFDSQTMSALFHIFLVYMCIAALAAISEGLARPL